MPVPHETIYFDVNDFKVWPLLTDVVGASPTYGALVDVPGIASVGVDPNLVTAILKGDARVMARKGRTDQLNISATYGKLAGDALAVMLGMSVTDVAEAGSVPEHARFRLKSPASLPYFKAAFQIDDVDTGLGTLHVILYKTQLSGGTLIGSQTDQFGQPTLTAGAIALEGDLDGDTGVMGDWKLYADAYSISNA